jgi:hypothetical protein
VIFKAGKQFGGVQAECKLNAETKNMENDFSQVIFADIDLRNKTFVL